MPQQTLQTIVAIGGRIDNSFGQIGNALVGMGSQIDMISRKLLEFGKESLEKYTNYDDLMREVKAVGEFTDAQIKSLDKINTRIAKTTIYSNIQAAQAEVIMGQYGMTVKEIQTLLPDVLELAMAGNLSIADSVDYLYSSLMSVGKGFDYAHTFTNMMTKTAAKGATDIDTLGDSLARLGSGAQMFKGGSPEIFSILSAMSQFGQDQRGSQAGTWIRNFMLSLVAPTGDIDAMTDAMYELGYSAEEIDEWAGSRTSGAAAAAVQTLVDAGLRIYDESGNLLPAIDIIRSLRDAVKGSGAYAGDLMELSGALQAAGGDIETFLASTDRLPDNALYAIMRTIFNRRGITTALNLISISDEEWAEITGAVMNSEGFAASMAATMQGGLGGAQRELDAVYIKFKSHIGDILSDPVEGGTDFLKNMLVTLDDVDDGKLEAITGALVPLAVAGPGLIATGAAFRLIGYALGPAGGVLLGALALSSAVIAIEKLREADMVDNFGNMDLDAESLQAYVTELSNAYRTAYGQVNEFTEALDNSVSSYKAASGEFSQKLLTLMLTGATLTDADKTKLMNLGADMGSALNEGIWLSTAATMNNIGLLFGGEGAAEYDANYQVLISALDGAKDDMLSNAAGLSQGLRDELLSAFEDGEISEDEYAKIKEWFQAYNQAIAEISREVQSEENAVALQLLLHKGQTGSFDSAQEYGNQILAMRDTVLGDSQEQYLKDYYTAKLALDQEVADLHASGASEQELKAKEAENAAALAALETKYQAEATRLRSPYDSAYTLLWDTMLSESDLGAAYRSAQDMTAQYLQGLMSGDTAVALLRGQYGNNYLAGEGGLWNQTSDRAQLGQILVREIMALGGYDALADQIAYYEREGDTQTALRLRELQAMEQIVNGFTESYVAENTWFGWEDGKVIAAHAMGDYSKNTPLDTGILGGVDVETASKLIGLADPDGGIAALWEALTTDGTSVTEIATKLQNLTGGQRDALDEVTALLAQRYDFAAVLADMGGADRYGDLGDLAAVLGLVYGSVRQNQEDYLLNTPATLPIDPALSDAALQGEIDNAQTLLNQTPGYWTINPLLRDFVMDTPPASGLPGFADGGRATDISIFGESGPEWAIPEQHSQRTAELLSAAAAASGFTWPELIGNLGGLNADPVHTPAQLVYAPTIIVKDARGVEDALTADKERLEKWYRERQMRDEMERYS